MASKSQTLAKQLNMDNARIFNRIVNRTSGGHKVLTYSDRIPRATQSDIRTSIEALKTYDPDWNDFMNILMNDIVLTIYRENNYVNPMRILKRDGIYSEGSWIQEIGYGLVDAHTYDGTATNVYGRRDVDVWANYHYQNRKSKYVLSVSPDILEQAMVGPDPMGVSRLINGLLSRPTTSDELDEYLIMRHLFAEYQRADGFFNVNIQDINTLQGEEKKNALLDVAEVMRTVNLDFTFMRTQYNAQGIPSRSTNTVLFATPQFLSGMDVRVLAYAFNESRANIIADRVIVVDDFEMPGTYAVLADADLMVCANTKLKTASAYNPDADFTNYFLHHWGIYSMSRFVNAVRFSTDPSTTVQQITSNVTGVTVDYATVDGVKPTYAERGAWTQLEATVQGENANQAVSWTIIGTSGVPKDTNTYIDGHGRLWVSSEETNAWITVRAQSVQSPSMSADIQIGIGGTAPDSSAVTALNITGNATIEQGGTLQLGATVTGDAAGRVIWSCTGSPDVTIDQHGLLTASESAVAKTVVTVVAISQINPAVMNTKEVTVSDAA